MEKCKLEKIRTTQQILENLGHKVKKLTSGNMSHQVSSLRSVTTNLNSVMIDDIIESCENDNMELKQLLEKIKRNIIAIDNVLQSITPTTVNNAKKQLINWIEFYADALNKALMKYEI